MYVGHNISSIFEKFLQKTPFSSSYLHFDFHTRGIWGSIYEGAVGSILYQNGWVGFFLGEGGGSCDPQTDSFIYHIMSML